MDALMAALVAAALARIGDRTVRLTAILADRWRRPGLAILAAALTVTVASGIAATGGTLAAPLLTPEARMLLVALALLLQGGGALFAATVPGRLAERRPDGFAATVPGLFGLALGDGVQFIVVALAARSGSPWGAAIGATIGSLAVLVPAAFLGERAWTAWPLGRVRRLVGVAFVVTGVVLALGALRLT